MAIERRKDSRKRVLKELEIIGFGIKYCAEKNRREKEK